MTMGGLKRIVFFCVDRRACFLLSKMFLPPSFVRFRLVCYCRHRQLLDVQQKFLPPQSFRPAFGFRFRPRFRFTAFRTIARGLFLSAFTFRLRFRQKSKRLSPLAPLSVFLSAPLSVYRSRTITSQLFLRLSLFGPAFGVPTLTFHKASLNRFGHLPFRKKHGGMIEE